MKWIVTGVTGRQPMYSVHRFEVEARNKTEAKRRIRQSTRGYVDGEPVRNLAADPAPALDEEASR